MVIVQNELDVLVVEDVASCIDSINNNIWFVLPSIA